MAKQRMIKTTFRTDPFIESLDSEEKLLFIYLLTNEATNLCGIYEASKKRISFETWLPIEKIEKSLNNFTEKEKVFYLDGYIIIKNHVKHNVSSPSITEWIKRELLTLPSTLTDKFTQGTTLGTPWGHSGLLYLTLLNLTSLNSTVPEKPNIDFQLFWDLYNKKIWDKNKCEKKWYWLKDEDRSKIIETLPARTRQFSDKQYQPYPETYLNQSRRNDEIGIVQYRKSQAEKKEYSSSDLGLDFLESIDKPHVHIQEAKTD